MKATVVWQWLVEGEKAGSPVRSCGDRSDERTVRSGDERREGNYHQARVTDGSGGKEEGQEGSLKGGLLGF